MSARFFVQTREHGGSWKTQTPTLDIASAQSYADALARMSQRVDALGRDFTIPLHPYVRVAQHGKTVYEPARVEAP